MFQRLLQDSSVTVRCVAIQGVCRICNVFWELIPAKVIQTLLLTLVRELAWDSSSADVRQAVLRVGHVTSCSDLARLEFIWWECCFLLTLLHLVRTMKCGLHTQGQVSTSGYQSPHSDMQSSSMTPRKSRQIMTILLQYNRQVLILYNINQSHNQPYRLCMTCYLVVVCTTCYQNNISHVF